MTGGFGVFKPKTYAFLARFHSFYVGIVHTIAFSHMTGGFGIFKPKTYTFFRPFSHFVRIVHTRAFSTEEFKWTELAFSGHSLPAQRPMPSTRLLFVTPIHCSSVCCSRHIQPSPEGTNGWIRQLPPARTPSRPVAAAFRAR